MDLTEDSLRVGGYTYEIKMKIEKWDVEKFHDYDGCSKWVYNSKWV